MTVEEKKATYEILNRGEYADYVIINRHTTYLPYVACYAFDYSDYTWGQGYYFGTYSDALVFMYEKEKDAIDGLIDVEMDKLLGVEE